jgi:hypothetical protein
MEMVNVFVGPGQDFVPMVKVGETTIVAVATVVVGFVKENDGIFPFPDAVKPILGLLFVQE